ncbi:hypothetical protein [Luteipulveratus halotolerans]|uniref:hypothetical protein n=1 Tax=Luteipulveratus halotolerans TaxID=1631356 RepID=UPI0012F891D4|nr:hypothetical protein [Luteipulveratus halotolerans]
MAATLLLAGVALALENRRDLTASMFPARLGPARGRMASMGALAARLQRGSLMGWAVGMAVWGFAIGAIADGILDLLKDNANGQDILQKMGGGGALIDTYFGAITPIAAVIAVIHGVTAINRVALEENEFRGELVLATATPRGRYFGQHLLWALGGAVVIMLVAGVTIGLGYLVTTGDGDRFLPLVGASLAQVPAMWVVIGVGVLGVGLSTRLTVAGWAAVGVCLFMVWIAPLLDVPDAVMDVSPFRHLPLLPGADMSWTPLVVLTAVAAALVGAGWAAYYRRDIA